MILEGCAVLDRGCFRSGQNARVFCPTIQWELRGPQAPQSVQNASERRDAGRLSFPRKPFLPQQQARALAKLARLCHRGRKE